MSPADEIHVKNVLKFFYPQQIPPDRISDEVAKLTAEMLSEALKGSKAMDFVPRMQSGRRKFFPALPEAAAKRLLR